MRCCFSRRSGREQATGHRSSSACIIICTRARAHVYGDVRARLLLLRGWKVLRTGRRMMPSRTGHAMTQPASHLPAYCKVTYAGGMRGFKFEHRRATDGDARRSPRFASSCKPTSTSTSVVVAGAVSDSGSSPVQCSLPCFSRPVSSIPARCPTYTLLPSGLLFAFCVCGVHGAPRAHRIPSSCSVGPRPRPIRTKSKFVACTSHICVRPPRVAFEFRPSSLNSILLKRRRFERR